ncbi:MAG: hypothetical protein LIP10_07370 [Clostridiales bacterium]|nr:hypothetical protein [Clostridiales bacterium]
MNKITKRLHVFLVSGVLLTGCAIFPSLAAENEVSTDRDISMPVAIDAEQFEALEKTTWDIDSTTGIPKTVKRTYTDITSIPAALSYREYIDGEWYGGILVFEDTSYSSVTKLYTATFNGTLYLQE